MHHISHRYHRISHTTAFVTPVVEHWLERVFQGNGARGSVVDHLFVGRGIDPAGPNNGTVDIGCIRRYWSQPRAGFLKTQMVGL